MYRVRGAVPVFRCPGCGPFPSLIPDEDAEDREAQLAELDVVEDEDDDVDVGVAAARGVGGAHDQPDTEHRCGRRQECHPGRAQGPEFVPFGAQDPAWGDAVRGGRGHGGHAWAPVRSSTVGYSTDP